MQWSRVRWYHRDNWLSLWYLLTLDHCFVWSSLIYGYWLSLWYLLTLDHCIVWSFFDLRLLIISTRQCNGLELEDTTEIISSRKSKKIRQWNGLELEDTTDTISSRKSKKIRISLWYLLTLDHCIVWSSLIYGYWLSLWYLLTLDHCIVWSSLTYCYWLSRWYHRDNQ
jgi:hypothetical protein